MTESMTEAEYQAILRTDLLSFIERAFYELNPNTRLRIAPYLEVLTSKLLACSSGNCKRLIVCILPRHLKSFAASIAFVAFLLGHNVALKIVCASYGQELAEDLARKCRTLMNSPFYKALFPIQLSDRQAVHDFMTTENGVRIATSVGGVLTGRGGDIVIIDDPLKPDEAMSDTRRKSVNDWYDNTLRSRLDDKENGCIIIIMQRLHQDDLIGHVLEQGKVGDLLDSTRESRATLQSLRRSLGEYNFSAQSLVSQRF
jgi:hypothetical protein